VIVRRFMADEQEQDCRRCRRSAARAMPTANKMDFRLMEVDP